MPSDKSGLVDPFDSAALVDPFADDPFFKDKDLDVFQDFPVAAPVEVKAAPQKLIDPFAGEEVVFSSVLPDELTGQKASGTGVVQTDTSKDVNELSKEDFKDPTRFLGTTETVVEGYNAFQQGVGFTAAEALKAPAIAGLKKDMRFARSLERLQQGRELREDDAAFYGTRADVNSLKLAKAQQLIAGIEQAKTPEEKLLLQTEFNVIKDENTKNILNFQDTTLFRAGRFLEKKAVELHPTRPELADSFGISLVPRALGSSMTFMATSIIGTKGLTVFKVSKNGITSAPVSARGAGGVMAASVGGAVSYTNGFEQALQDGATIEEAFEAAELKFLGGTSEAFPVASLLNRLDKFGGGRIKNAFLNALKQGFEEGGQELGQAIYENAVEMGVYDKDTGLWTGAPEGTAVGATSGMILGFISTLILGKNSRINNTTDRLPTPEELMKAVKDQIMQENLDLDMSFEGAAKEDLVDSDSIEPRKLTEDPRGSGNFGDVADLLNQTNLKDPTKADPDNWVDGEVQTTDSEIFFGEEIASVEEQIAVLEEEAAFLEQAKAGVVDGSLQGVGELEYYIKLDATSKLIYEKKGELGKLQQEQAFEQEVLPQIQGYLQALIQAYDPSLKVIVGGRSLSLDSLGHTTISAVYDGTAEGSAAWYNDGFAQIAINFQQPSNMTKQDMADVALTATTHEFGHVLIEQNFYKQPFAVQEALYRDWRKWRKSMVESPNFEKWAAQRFDYLSFQRMLRGTSKTPSSPWRNVVRSKRDYYLGFTEFVAEQFSRGLVNNRNLNSISKRFFKDTSKQLRRVARVSKDTFGSTETYGDLIQSLGNKAQLDFLNNIKPDQTVEERIDELSTNNVEFAQRLGKIMQGLTGGKGNFGKWRPPYNQKDLEYDIAAFNGVIKHGTTLLQLFELNKGIPGLKRYVETIKAWHSQKMKWTQMADERLAQWKSLGKERNSLGDFLQELTILSQQTGKKYTLQDAEYQELVEKYELSPEALATADLVDTDFLAVLDSMEESILADLERTHRNDASLEKFNTNVAEVTKNFQELRNRNFFPLSRFGKFALMTYANKAKVVNGVAYKVNDIISFETYETEGQRKAAFKSYKGQKDIRIGQTKLSDVQQMSAGLPPQLMNLIEERLNLNPDQMKAFQDIKKDIAPGQSFLKHMKQRKITEGYANDAMRSYANYFMFFGSYAAKLRYKSTMSDSIDEVTDQERRLTRDGGKADKFAGIRDYLQEHNNYIMNPTNEWAALRALGFFWFLGFNLKSAAINLTQVPFVAYPYLAARYGDGKTVGKLKAAYMKDLKYWKGKSSMETKYVDMFNQLAALLNESLATELAAVTEGSVLGRILPGTVFKSEKVARGIQRTMEASAFFFQKAEGLNRRVTAFAAYDLAIESGANHQEAVEAAREAVEQTQFEFAGWNRPAFMRGKKSTIFLFWMYKQHMVFFLANDPGKWRYLGLLGLFGGMAGLPFATNLMDVATAMMQSSGGGDEPEKRQILNSRIWLREYVADLGTNPDLMMHGLSSTSMGLTQVANLIGMPMVDVNVSGTLGMGDLVPGVSGFLNTTRSPEERLAEGAVSVAGAVAAIPVGFYQALTSTDPNIVKRVEKAMPKFMRSISAATRKAVTGEETNRAGVPIVKYDIENAEHRAELIAQALNFQTTRESRAKEKHYLTQNIAKYYETRRRLLLEDLSYALRTEDKKMYSQAWVAVMKYNKNAPLGFTIAGQDVMRSIKSRMTKRFRGAAGLILPNKQLGLQFEIEKSFSSVEEPEEEQPKLIDPFSNDTDR